MDFKDVVNKRRSVSFFDRENYRVPLLLAVGYFHPKETPHPPRWRKT